MGEHKTDRQGELADMIDWARRIQRDHPGALRVFVDRLFRADAGGMRGMPDGELELIRGAAMLGLYEVISRAFPEACAAPAASEASADLFERYTAELRADGWRPIDARITTIDAVCAVAQLQLALRHPGNRGFPAQRGERVARLLEEHAGRTPAVKQVLAMGWKRRYDQT